MEKYISLDALVAKIKRRAIEAGLHDGVIAETREDECYSILSLIDTLEVKEVDLEKEIEEHAIDMPMSEFTHESEVEDFYEWARKEFRYFFKLGVNASNPLTWEDMMLIHKCIKDAMNYHLYKMMEGMEGQKVVYEEVLKRFKAKKGE